MTETGKGAKTPTGDGASKMTWRPTEVSARRGVDIDIAPDAEARAALAADLGILGIGDLRLTGRLQPEGRQDFRLDARMRAEVDQACVVTLAPVRSVIEEPVQRRFLAEMPAPSGDEVEMPEDDSAEPLGSVIDLWGMLREALLLALPPYPRAAAAEAGAADTTQSGAENPVGTRRPFAGLSDLLAKGGDGT